MTRSQRTSRAPTHQRRVRERGASDAEQAVAVLVIVALAIVALGTMTAAGLLAR